MMASVGSIEALAAEAQGESQRQLEEVVVTAQKREQNLKDVPVSITALDMKTIEDSGLTGIQDLAQMAPGLIFAESVGRQTTTPSIRGVAPASFADPTVAVMIDGYTSGFQRQGNNATLVELERIEILRGPQATLYGRNAIGGVINYITRKPDDELRASLRVDAATRNNYTGQGYVSGPILEGIVYGGLAAGYRDSGGFLDNAFTGESDVNDEKDLNGRLSLRFTPSDLLNINFSLDYNEAEDAAGDPRYAYHELYASGAPPSAFDLGAGKVNLNDFGQTISQDFLGGFDREETTAVLNIEYDLGWATLTSITGASNQETSVRTGISRLQTSAFDFDVIWNIETVSQELRLASDSDGSLQWMIGAYYFDNERERFLLLDFDDGEGFVDWANSLDEVENRALFGNLEYAITDDISVMLGLRYDTEDRTQSDLFAGTSVSSSVDEVLPSISMTYQPNYEMTFYGTVSRGYHAGGPNPLDAVAVGAPDSFEPEFVTNYEIGLKGTSRSNSVSYEMALFFMDWEDQQLFTEFDVFANRFVVNAGESSIYGIEASSRVQLTQYLSLTAALSYLNAEYEEFFNPIDALPFALNPDLSGNDLPYAPDFSMSASAQYVAPVGDSGWDLRFRADFAHVGEQAFDSTNIFIADSYSLLDLYLGIQNERYELGLFGTNVTDEEYLTGGSVSATLPPFATIGDPSIWGVRLRVRM
ncbi:TonB-dependent receptor [Pseudohaliea sp.]|uniref:TonB-dependent receptor n=1 Tax=Pseudohaliea sp. TaxID=2740289 RepID=UPI0032EB945F